jgi:hypothetical protein
LIEKRIEAEILSAQEIDENNLDMNILENNNQKENYLSRLIKMHN